MTARGRVPIQIDDEPRLEALVRRATVVLLSVALLLGAAWVVRAAAPSMHDTSRSGPPAQPAEASSPAAPARSGPSHLYVSDSGRDTNPGTAARPYRSIRRADEAARPGTTVHVGPGHYGATVTRRSGTRSAPIRYLSQVSAGAVLATGSTIPWTNHGSWVDVIGFDISAPGARAGLFSLGSHVGFYGNRVHDVATSISCTPLGGGGIMHAEYHHSAGNVVAGNWVRDVGPRQGCDKLQGVYVAQAAGLVVNNIVSRVSAWCIHTWHAATEVTIANNLVFDCGTGTDGGGIVVGAGDRPGGVSASHCTVSNNIVLDSVQAITEVGHVGPGNRYTSNLLHGNDTNRTSLLRGTARGTLFEAPRFVRFTPDGRGDYGLVAGSPGVDAGTRMGMPGTDLAGVRRPRGAEADIGPYER